ncbi:MAG: replication-associated recombination protein A [Chloroflexota bacterium]
MNMFDRQLDEQLSQEAPLATRMRPTALTEFVGQEHLVGAGRLVRKAIDSGQLPSMILWGPPGSGKTTLAYIIANSTKSNFSPISAVSSGVAEVRRLIDEAREYRKMYRQRTILFIDEIHRFNKAQQDAILPVVEDGTITLIGATTENPSFEVIAPLLSRCRVLTLNPLNAEELRIIIFRAIKDKLKGLGALNAELSPEALQHLITGSNNDARIALNALELAALATTPDAKGHRYIELPTVEEALQHKALRYDKEGEQHYDVISALHKAMRGSDPNASLYWLTRMLEAGEDPLYVARRLIRFASEDVGLADPWALVFAVAAQQAVQFLGMPEGNLALAQAATYLASAPKSNSLYEAYGKAQEEIKKSLNQDVPLHLRNPVTPMMKEMGYGKDYKYPHDYPDHFVEQQNLPDAIKDSQFYTPSDQGYEQDVTGRLKSWWRDIGKPKDYKHKEGDD